VGVVVSSSASTGAVRDARRVRRGANRAAPQTRGAPIPRHGRRELRQRHCRASCRMTSGVCLLFVAGLSVRAGFLRGVRGVCSRGWSCRGRFNGSGWICLRACVTGRSSTTRLTWFLCSIGFCSSSGSLVPGRRRRPRNTPPGWSSSVVGLRSGGCSVTWWRAPGTWGCFSCTCARLRSSAAAAGMRPRPHAPRRRPRGPR